MLPGLMFCLGSTELEFSALKISWSDVVFEFTMEPGLAVGLDEVAWPETVSRPSPSGAGAALTPSLWPCW
jgi:hypothetical protein